MENYKTQVNFRAKYGSSHTRLNNPALRLLNSEQRTSPTSFSLDHYLEKWQRANTGKITSLSQLFRISGGSKAIIYDAEYTSWEGAMERNWSAVGEHPEVFQIGALKISLNGTTKSEDFNILIKPRINKKLSDYSIKLCGISQEQIELQGIQFEEAIMKLFCISEGGRLPLFSYGQDASFLVRNARLYNTYLPDFQAGFYDVRPLFKNLGIDVDKYSSGTLHQAFSLNLEVSVHNALHDSKSLAASLQKALHPQKQVTYL